MFLQWDCDDDDDDDDGDDDGDDDDDDDDGDDDDDDDDDDVGGNDGHLVETALCNLGWNVGSCLDWNSQKIPGHPRSTISFSTFTFPVSSILTHAS